MARSVLITAGASGIGREFVRAFSASGDKIFVCDIDAGALKLLKDEIPAIATHVCDLAKRTEIETMVTEGVRMLGGFDILINNAGIAGPTAPVDEIDPAEWDKVMQIDLTATFDVTRLLVPYLKKSGAGSIINMSSMAGRFGYENRSPYSTAKWGIIGFTKTLSIELGKYGIRVNAILPGPVEGERMDRVLEGRAKISGRSVQEEKQNALSLQSIKQFVDPRDIAALAVFLASDNAKMISGQLFPIDGDIQKAS